MISNRRKIARSIAVAFWLLGITLQAQDSTHNTIPLLPLEHRHKHKDFNTAASTLPQVRILARRDVPGDFTLLELECILTNHLNVPIDYHGHSVGAWAVRPPTGWIHPVCQLETRNRDDSEWNRAMGGRGGTGYTTMHVPPHHVGRFRVSVPLSNGQVRVGVECGWSMDGDRRGARIWSDACPATIPTRRPAIMELAKRRDITALLHAMRSKDVYVRLEAAQGLSWLVLNARESVKGLPPRRLQELVSALETALSDADHRVRHQATAGLVELGGVQSHRPLRLAAEDAHADVRLVAVTALSYLDDPESRATLRKAAADTEHEIRWIDHARPGCFVCLR